jgi:NADPH-dependent 2,4-dienoyl-CoA reductase/sulfur reductase-like enzyme
MAALSVLLLLVTIIHFTIALRNTDRDTSFEGFQDSVTIRRDVAIIGGGSSGTHAAISLKDKGYRSIVVEKNKRLGGHTETYVDPSSGTPIDYGVVIFHNEW